MILLIRVHVMKHRATPNWINLGYQWHTFFAFAKADHAVLTCSANAIGESSPIMLIPRAFANRRILL